MGTNDLTTQEAQNPTSCVHRRNPNHTIEPPTAAAAEDVPGYKNCGEEERAGGSELMQERERTEQQQQ